MSSLCIKPIDTGPVLSNILIEIIMYVSRVRFSKTSVYECNDETNQVRTVKQNSCRGDRSRRHCDTLAAIEADHVDCHSLRRRSYGRPSSGSRRLETWRETSHHNLSLSSSSSSSYLFSSKIQYHNKKANK